MLGKQTKLLSVVSRRSLGDLVHFRPSLQRCNFTTSLGCCRHSKSNKDGKGKKKQLSSIVQAVTVKPLVDPDGINVGEELSGSLDRGKLCCFNSCFKNRRKVFGVIFSIYGRNWGYGLRIREGLGLGLG